MIPFRPYDPWPHDHHRYCIFKVVLKMSCATFYLQIDVHHGLGIAAGHLHHTQHDHMQSHHERKQETETSLPRRCGEQCLVQAPHAQNTVRTDYKCPQFPAERRCRYECYRTCKRETRSERKCDLWELCVVPPLVSTIRIAKVFSRLWAGIIDFSEIRRYKYANRGVGQLRFCILFVVFGQDTNRNSGSPRYRTYPTLASDSTPPRPGPGSWTNDTRSCRTTGPTCPANGTRTAIGSRPTATDTEPSPECRVPECLCKHEDETD